MMLLSVQGKRDDIIVRLECKQVNIRLYASIQTNICLLTFRMVCHHHVVSKKTSPKTGRKQLKILQKCAKKYAKMAKND